MEEYLKKHGIEVENYLSGFNQLHQEILSPNSGLKSFNPDFVVIYVDIEEMLWEHLLDENIEKSIKLIDELLNTLDTAADSFKYILVNNTYVRNVSDGILYEKTSKYIENYYNNKIEDLRRSKNNLFVVDYKSIIETHGYNTLFSSKMMYLGSIRFSKKGFTEIAKLYGRYIRAILGKIKKVIVLDADGVLWGGIIGEDELNGIKLDAQKEGRIYKDFQKVIKNMTKKGVVLALNSKNNENDVMEVFEKHPHMVLKKEDFATMKINWQDKVTNMKEIAKELNLGLDSFVFIDDSKFERELIRKELPQVTVPDFPKDTGELVEFISEIEKEYFPKVYVTEEDRKRAEMYKAQVQREKLKKSASSIEEFLRDLKMKMIIGQVNEQTIKRVAQLTQRTNQFNMTTKRYTEKDILEMKEKGYKIYWMRLLDKFGDNGIVGVVIVKPEGEKAYIDTFLMSCRVIGRTAENAFLGFVEKELYKMGIKYIEAEYIPTKKNGLIKEKYEELGYKLMAENDGIKKYKKELPDDMMKIPEWIEVEIDGK